MSCNPAIGGIGKATWSKEVDAMGGIMARAIDHAGISSVFWNSFERPAVQSYLCSRPIVSCTNRPFAVFWKIAESAVVPAGL